MGTVLFAICFFLVVKTSGDYLAKEIIINRPTLRNMNNEAQVDGILQAARGSSNFECGEFNAVSPSGVIMNRSIHECECTREASTFSFFEEQWKCVDSEVFRESKGKCEKLFITLCSLRQGRALIWFPKLSSIYDHFNLAIYI